MDSLPEELLLDIISLLDRGPPSDAKFFDEPDPLTLTSFRDHPLKALSRVSPRWRRIIKPMLFQHLKLRIDVDDSPKTPWIPRSAPELQPFRSFLSAFKLPAHVKTFVVCAFGELYDRPAAANNTLSNDFWTMIFEFFDPQSIKIAASPAVLALLAGSSGNYEHSWAFEQSHHVLELRQNLHSTYDRFPNGLRNPYGLMVRRRWCHIGYNEGSSLPVYNLFAYQHYMSPCVLRHILMQVNWDTNSATSFAYVAIFPTSENLLLLARHLTLIPKHCSMVFQLAPEPTSTILHEPDRMRRAQPADLWVELDRGYELLTGSILHHKLQLSVKSRDYRWNALVETLDDDGHLGSLKRHGWSKIDDSEWVPDSSQEHGPVSVVC
ncbi:F-box domain-containing protein [Neofusicoccum parvum]|nr:F-box domain-containing protein [Neofusicoccum parvum]